MVFIPAASRSPASSSKLFTKPTFSLPLVGLLLLCAAWLLPGLQVAGFTAALVASLLYSICGIVIDAVLERVFDES